MRRVLVCALCVCGAGVGVGVSSVCVGACVAACGGLFPWLGLAAGVSVGGGVVGVWAVPRHSWRRFLRVFPRHVWIHCAASGGGCCSPLLAEGPGCGPMPLLARVRRRWWCVVAFPILVVVLVMVPRHSWLGSAGHGGGRLRWFGWGFLVVCVFVARCVRAWCLC